MKKYSKWKVGLLASLAVLLLAAGIGYANRGALEAWGYDMFFSKQVEKKLADSYRPLQDRPVSQAVQIEKPFSVLLMGVDSRANEPGRSDTLIYSVIRPMDGNVLMISIPRDTYAEIAGRNKYDKITHSYVFGGPEMTVSTVEKLLQAKVDHYASINFQGFVQVVDTLGGIPLPITEDIVNKGKDHEKFTIKANQSLYNGKDALNFVRYREDAGDDVSRAQRNRVFLEALIHKTASMQQWSKIPEILGIIGDNFRTDILPSSMTDLAKKFLQADHRIKSYTLSGVGKRMGPSNLWYFVADENDLQAVRDTITTWLNPSSGEAQLTVPSETSPAIQPQIPA
ncbi:LytR family transcriptional regulator [Cohnella pontilimi]|uniref:LytR family transcriptional regulator n=1 Tax=Cohnella pontilimi TaxID=2564100 RepID=A0A4U0FAP3_9BACL|nr:LCP family protein [Cohnella pontilimi]TJY41721.1 LytR family transcriptional regulator [Cohnella pontilimi]